MMKKMTKKEMFIQIKTHLTNQEEIDFIDRQIELLENKKQGTRKPTATQQENEKIKAEIVAFLNEYNSENFTISELSENIESLKELSNQRISAILKQLVDNGEVIKTYEKRKAYFSIMK